MSPPKPAYPDGNLDPHAPVVIPTGPDGPTYPLATAALLAQAAHLPPPPAGALVAETLADFGGVDQSLVFPKGAAKEMTHITQLGPRTFNFYLRHRGDPSKTKGAFYDGDRDGNNNAVKHETKSRAEVHELFNAKIQAGDTWEIGTTVRLDPHFVPNAGYCIIMQPILFLGLLNLTGINGNTVTAELSAVPGGIGGNQVTVKQFGIVRGEWTNIRIRVKLSKDGFYACSVNGGPFATTNLNLSQKTHAYTAKWGLYGQATQDVHHQALNDSQIQHTNIYLHKLG